MSKLRCPITGEELIYIGRDEGVLDGNSYYSPINDRSIIFSVHPFSRNIYVLVDSMGYHAKEARCFRLNEDSSWTEMKRVPHGNLLFAVDDFTVEWVKACEDAEINFQKRQDQIRYWNEHPEEDPRIRGIRAKLVSMDLVKPVPMSPPSGMLFFMDYIYSDKNE